MNILELLTTDFILNAVIGGLILAILLSVLSLFIYVKKWSFINVGISHAAFGGLAIGYIAGISPSITGSIFAVIVGILIGFLSKRGKFHEDISIGILLSFSMALGVILISFSNNYNSDLFSFLFGNILTITREDITTLGIFTVIAFAFLYVYFKKLLYCCFDEEVAKVSGVKTDFLYYSLIVLMAIATVLSIKLVGSILASAMMILPAATSSQIFWHYRSIVVFSIIISIFTVVTGIFISFEFNLPSGSTIVMVYSVIFFVITAVKRFLK
ncbi:MAG: metal ABC transporter permease [Hydrogenothermaceae bacterium]|nr:metal ABC transporter permease [Hydrogenothermaceae bacterium]